MIYVSTYPSIATRLTDRLSIAASLALTYMTYEQRKAVPDIESGDGDGGLVVDTSKFSAGYGPPLLYELNSRSRPGFNYRSQIEPSLDGRLVLP